jgi:hypothetical protein
MVSNAHFPASLEVSPIAELAHPLSAGVAVGFLLAK